MQAPSFRRHATGQWFTRWGGKNHYLGVDKPTAEEKYRDSMQAWADWRASKSARLDATKRKPLKLSAIKERFIDAKRNEVTPKAIRYYEYHLARFMVMFGNRDADLMKPSLLNQLKDLLISQRYSAKTINHDLTAVRVMLNWASGRDLVPPMSFRGVRNMPLAPVVDRTYSLQEIGRIVRRVDEKVRPWLVVNYLCCCRPSEMIRLVAEEGQWVDEGVFRLDRGKMDKRASIKRHIIVSPMAMLWLKYCSPYWTQPDSYSAYAGKIAGVSPKLMQKSGATHLAQLYGANRDDVELLLGHVKGRLSVTYFQPAWQRLRAVASLLTIPPVLSKE